MSSRPPTRALTDRIAVSVVRRRWWVVGTLLLLTLVAGVVSVHVPFEFDIESLYTVDGEMLAYARGFRDDFQNDDMLLMVVLQAEGERDVLDRNALAWQVETARSMARLPMVERVATLSTWELPRPRLRPPFYLNLPVVRGIPPTVEDERRLRALLDEYELVERSLVSADRRTSVLMLTLDPERRGMDDLRSAVAAAREVLSQSPPPEGYLAHLTGLPVVRAAVIDDLKRDQLRQVPLLAGLFIAMLIALFRHPGEALLPLVAVGMAVTWTVGLMAVMGWSFNLISNALPVLLLVIGVSNCVHVICRFREDLPKCRGSAPRAAAATMSEMMVACLLTCLTTAIGFLSLVAAGSPVLRQFGLEAAAGMLLLYVATVFCLGAGLATLRAIGPTALAPPPTDCPRQGWLATVASRLGTLGARHPLPTLGVAVLVVAGSLTSASRVTINASMLETYGHDHPVRVGIDLVQQQLFGFSTLEVSLTAEQRDAFFDPANFRRVAEFGEFAREVDGVIMVRSYVDLLQTAYQSFRERDPRRHQLPRDDALGRARIDFSRQLAERFDGHMGIRAFFSNGRRRARILCAMEDVGSRRLLEIIDRFEAKLAELFPPSSGVKPRVTGESLLFARSLDQLIRNVFYSICMASALIFVIIGLLFRSVRAGLTAMVPNVFPLILTIGYMGLRGYHLNAGNVIVFAVSIGIAVDNTIHFLARLEEERRGAGTLSESIDRALRGSGRAVILTTFIIIVGLTVMFSSEFLPTRRFAELTSVTMAAALLGDLIVLPACVALIYRRRRAGT